MYAPSTPSPCFLFCGRSPYLFYCVPFWPGFCSGVLGTRRGRGVHQAFVRAPNYYERTYYGPTHSQKNTLQLYFFLFFIWEWESATSHFIYFLNLGWFLLSAFFNYSFSKKCFRFVICPGPDSPWTGLKLLSFLLTKDPQIAYITQILNTNSLLLIYFKKEICITNIG